MNKTISDSLWNELIQEATAVRWVMFRAGAQPTKSDVEDILMDRHGLERYWPHVVMNHLETNDVLGPSIRERRWLGNGDEPQMTSDILALIRKKAGKSRIIRRHLTQEVLEALEQ